MHALCTKLMLHVGTSMTGYVVRMMCAFSHCIELIASAHIEKKKPAAGGSRTN